MNKTWMYCVVPAAAFLAGSLFGGTEANAGDVTLSIDAQVTSTLVEDSPTPLNFGTIDPNPAGDVITIDAFTDGAGASPVAASGSGIVGGAPGEISVVSASTLTIQLDFGADTVDLTNPTADIMTVNNFTALSEGSDGNEIAYPGGSVTQLIYVGADLNIPAGAPNGLYEEDMTVTLIYE